MPRPFRLLIGFRPVTSAEGGGTRIKEEKGEFPQIKGEKGNAQFFDPKTVVK